MSRPPLGGILAWSALFAAINIVIAGTIYGKRLIARRTFQSRLEPIGTGPGIRIAVVQWLIQVAVVTVLPLAIVPLGAWLFR